MRAAEIAKVPFMLGQVLLMIFVLTRPVGGFLGRVFNRERTLLDPVLAPVEKLIYRLTGISASQEMRWTEYGFGFWSHGSAAHGGRCSYGAAPVRNSG
jgi:K+-transporting ATPase A subunit